MYKPLNPPKKALHFACRLYALHTCYIILRIGYEYFPEQHCNGDGACSLYGTVKLSL
jgi:hypothetical protein